MTRGNSNNLCLVFSSSQFYLHNHLSFILYFHREKLEQGELHDYRVVRFEVVPQSVKVEGRCQCTLFFLGHLSTLVLTQYSLSDLKAVEKDKTCTLPEASGSAAQEIDPSKENEVLFTYSVHWEVSDCYNFKHLITRSWIFIFVGGWAKMNNKSNWKKNVIKV